MRWLVPPFSKQSTSYQQSIQIIYVVSPKMTMLGLLLGLLISSAVAFPSHLGPVLSAIKERMCDLRGSCSSILYTTKTTVMPDI